MSGNTNNTVFIQRLFSSRDNFTEGNVQEATANTANFVGQSGRIWWNPDLNNFYYSDGNTPGGILIGSGGSAGLPLANGTSNFDIPVANGNVTITSNTINTWTFDETGNLVLPANSFNVNYANGTQVPLGGGLPLANGNSNFDIPTADSFVTITSNTYWTWFFGPDGSLILPQNSVTGNIGAIVGPYGANTIIRAPAAGSAFVENNTSFNKLSVADSNITITTSPDSGSTYNKWIFDTTGNLTLPANSFNINYANGTQVSLYSNTDVANYLANYAGNIAGNNITVSNVANLGNFTISDQTLAGTINDRPIKLSPVGNAAVQLLNGIEVYQGNFEVSPLFSVSNVGLVTTIVSTPLSNIGAFEIVGNPAGNTVAPQNPGVLLHTTGQQDTPSRYYNDGVNAYGAIINRRYNGTSTSPTGVLANQIVGRVAATPYLQEGSWPQISTSRIDFVTLEDQTVANLGSAIQLWGTETGTNTAVIVAQFDVGDVLLTGNLTPNTTEHIYQLGNSTNKWGNLYLGPDSLYIEDSTLGTDANISVDNGALLINGVQSIQIGNMQMTSSGIQKIDDEIATAEDLTIGTAGGGNTFIRNSGIKFSDNTIQTTAAIPLSQRANAGGVATLGLDGIVPSSQLPGGGPVYKGTWNADTNTPTLADGTGSGGDEYAVVVAGTQNLGSGAITFAVGDFCIYNGTIWQKIPSGGTGVTSFNTRTGAVTLTSGDVTNALSSGSITNTKLANANITINTGFGLGGGAVVDLGGSISLTTTVGNILPGTGVGVSVGSGNYTISIGQPVGTANSVQFLAVSASSTIQATGNVTGGNLTTGGKVVATGNIETSGNLVTSNTVINSSITSNGNVNFTGSNISLGTVANVRITGGTSGQFLTTNGSGVLSWSNVSAANITGTIANANYAAYAGNVTIAGQANITSLGTLTGLTSGGVVNLTTASNVSLGSNANVKITGGGAGNVLTTDGAGNLRWSSPTSGNTVIQTGNNTVNIDFTYNTTTLLYLPTGPVTINLSNYIAGHTARVIIRFATHYTVNMGVANVQQTTEGATTLPISGAGGHKINNNQSVQLLYTCFDNTADNCYVATTFL